MEHTENKTIIHDTEKTASWEQQTAMKVSGISILVNLLLSVFKLIAGIVAHSGAMISDAIHSASDVGSTFIVIIGVRLSTKKSDKEHQYGHERMECVSSIVLAGMLLVTGLGIGITGARDIVKSTSGGTIAIMMDWRIALVVWGGFLVLAILTRYVSLGSLWAGASFPFIS